MSSAHESSTTQLFIDDAVIARKEGIVRRTHACRKLSQPVISDLESWQAPSDDERVYIYGTVLPAEAGDGLRMWYMRYPDQVLYAESEEGVIWRRPELGLVEHAGSARNNALPIRFHSPSVICDPTDPDPEHRYKMLGVSRAAESRGYCTAHSADGLNWRLYDANPVLTGGDTCCLARDPATGDYLAFHKRYGIHRGHRRRLVYLASSPDMQTWSEPALVMAPDEIDDAQTRAEGGRFSQFYNMSVFPYGGMWLGFVTHFRHTGPPAKKGPEQSRDDGPIDVQLVHSRDGRSWSRCEDRSPVIPNGPHDYDAGCILGVANGPGESAAEVRLYYTGITTTHGGYLPAKKISIARAAWRLDGWVSLYAGEAPATVETTPMDADGEHLFVNADAAKGELRAEILDPSGTAIPGYRLAECRPLSGDGIRQLVYWEAARTLPTDRPISIRFRFGNASLYSFATA